MGSGVEILTNLAAVKLLMLLSVLFLQLHLAGQNGIIVFQSDFGVKDGAVAAMKGVSMSVSDDLKLYDLTHEIPPFNIFEASYRLEQTMTYWPAGTVFVSVVDPGVGTDRKSVVLKTKTGHFIVTPDNGTLTHIAASAGIDTIREIDEAVNRRQTSIGSYTFHGRDVYAYTAARLASRVITFEQVGPLLKNQVVSLHLKQPQLKSGTITGAIPILDVQYGNVWTNIPDSLVKSAGFRSGEKLHIHISHNSRSVYSGNIPLVNTFGDVPQDSALAYFNSLMQLSFAINEGNFATKYGIGSGEGWEVTIGRRKEKGERR